MKDCPDEIDPVRVAKGRKEWKADKERQRKSKQSGSNEKNIPTRDSSGNTDEKKTQIPLSSANNDRLKNGVFQLKCYGCVGGKNNFKWGNHPTKHHARWLSDKEGYCLSAVEPNHPVVVKQKEFDASMAAARASTPNTNSSPQGGAGFTAAEFDSFAAKCASLMEVIHKHPNTYEASQAQAAFNTLQSDFKKRQGF